MKQTSQPKIIIIGAGIAGLAACTHLKEHGFDTMILEARDRCGGRIWTEHHAGIPFSLGASWIHGIEGNPIAQLAEKTHTKMCAMDRSKFIIYDRNGFAIPQDEIERFNKKFDALLLKAKELAFIANKDISLSTAFSSLINKNTFSPLEQDIFKTKLLWFEGHMGAIYECLSARHWDNEEIWPGDNCYLLGSYQPIIDYLKKDCRIQLSKIVKKINLQEGNIEIVTTDETFHADAVIITVSLGVLKKNVITFNPPLPEEKQKAIECLGMGLLNLTSIKFPTCFWQREKQTMRFTQFNTLSCPLFFNLHHFIEPPILIGTQGSERAQQLENLTDSELIEITMTNFRKFFGAKIPDPEFYLQTRWSRDPFSYGSYSYIPPGASSVDYETMAKPVANQLFFAGEATSSKHSATTHGAYLSGIREAERIISFYKKN
jgi:monoamine oxidase